MTNCNIYVSDNSGCKYIFDLAAICDGIEVVDKRHVSKKVAYLTKPKVRKIFRLIVEWANPDEVDMAEDFLSKTKDDSKIHADYYKLFKEVQKRYG